MSVSTVLIRSRAAFLKKNSRQLPFNFVVPAPNLPFSPPWLLPLTKQSHLPHTSLLSHLSNSFPLLHNMEEPSNGGAAPSSSSEQQPRAPSSVPASPTVEEEWSCFIVVSTFCFIGLWVSCQFSLPLAFLLLQSSQYVGYHLFVKLVLLWAVSMTMILGVYGSRDMLLGPNTSRLLQTNSFFVQDIEVRMFRLSRIDAFTSTHWCPLSVVSFQSTFFLFFFWR